MDLLQPWNQAIAYIEAHLCDEIDLEALSRIAGVSQDSFLRFFSYLTGISLHEYLRRRRLTLAVRDLQTGSDRIIDLAVKYGYESADAFSRAFARQHGTTPSVAAISTGYSDLYSFSKMFKQQYGVSPRVYIRQSLENPTSKGYNTQKLE